MSHAGTPPLLTVRCPECGAARGSRCKGNATHAARRAELAKAQKAHAWSEERKSEVRSLTPEQREAVANFKCPTCKMPPGKLCRGGVIHPRRMSKKGRAQQAPKDLNSNSVRAILGGAFDSNRRKH